MARAFRAASLNALSIKAEYSRRCSSGSCETAVTAARATHTAVSTSPRPWATSVRSSSPALLSGGSAARPPSIAGRNRNRLRRFPSPPFSVIASFLNGSAWSMSTSLACLRPFRCFSWPSSSWWLPIDLLPLRSPCVSAPLTGALAHEFRIRSLRFQPLASQPYPCDCSRN